MSAVVHQQRHREPMGAWERAFVEEKRRLGASWDAIAGMLRRPTPDVRRAFDPDYRDPFPAPVAPVAGRSRATSIAICGRRVDIVGMKPPVLAMLKALAHGGIESFAGLKARASVAEGEPLGKEAVRTYLRRLEKHLPPQLSLTLRPREGYFIQAVQEGDQ